MDIGESCFTFVILSSCQLESLFWEEVWNLLEPGQKKTGDFLSPFSSFKKVASLRRSYTSFSTSLLPASYCFPSLEDSILQGYPDIYFSGLSEGSLSFLFSLPFVSDCSPVGGWASSSLSSSSSSCFLLTHSNFLSHNDSLFTLADFCFEVTLFEIKMLLSPRTVDWYCICCQKYLVQSHWWRQADLPIQIQQLLCSKAACQLGAPAGFPSWKKRYRKFYTSFFTKPENRSKRRFSTSLSFTARFQKSPCYVKTHGKYIEDLQMDHLVIHSFFG